MEGLITTHSRSVLDRTCIGVCLLKVGILSVTEFACSGLVLLSVISKINAQYYYRNATQASRRWSTKPMFNFLLC